MNAQEVMLILSEPTIPDVCLWWVREDLTSLTPSVKDERLRDYENTFVKKFLKRDITFAQLDEAIREINKEYIEQHKNKRSV